MGSKFENPKWIVSDKGFQWENEYLGYTAPVLSKFDGLLIQAHAQPDILNTHTNPFEGGINCALYLKFTDPGNKFDRSAYEIISETMLIIFNEFKTRPVIFLMDESKKKWPPGDTWEPVELSVYKSMLNPWNFDYAILPRTLDQIYETVPPSHAFRKHDNYIEAWRVNKWKKGVF